MTSQLAMGKKVEMEHTTDPKVAEKIATDHIEELPDYYCRLKVMERPDFWRLLKMRVKKEDAKNPEGTEDYPMWQNAQFYKSLVERFGNWKFKKDRGADILPAVQNIIDLDQFHTKRKEERKEPVNKCPCGTVKDTDDAKKIRKADVFQTDPDDPGQEKEIRNLKLKSKLSPTKRDLKEVQEVNKDDIKKEWTLNIEEMLKSDREFSGTFHKPIIDKENDIIPASAMDLAMNDFMVLPMLQEVHTERPVGIITKTWKTKEDEYNFVGKVKPSKDCDDVWKKIQNGEYDGLSIGGRRIKYSTDCSIPSSIRTTPCVTHRLKLYNVSVCSSPVNPEATVSSVAKAEDPKLVFDITETLLKAETTDSNQSTKYDGVNKPMTKTEDDARGVSKSDDELITKSDITELTKAIGDFTKAAEELSKSLGGFQVEHTAATQRDPPRTPGAKAVKMHGAESSLKKDEDPDEDPDPEPKIKKSRDEVEEDFIEDLRKAYDDRISELETKIEKMGKEVVRKGGTAVVISEQLGKNDPMASSNMQIFEQSGMVAR